MQRRLVALVYAGLLTAFPACIDETDPLPSTAAIEGPADETRPLPAATNLPQNMTPTSGEDPLAWSASVTGDVVYRFVVEAPSTTRCALKARSDPVATTRGYSNFIVSQSASGLSWMLQGNGMQQARIQAMGVASTDPLVPSEWWEEPLVVEWALDDFSEPVTVTFGTRGLEGGDASNFAISFRCFGDFELTSFEGGRDLTIIEPPAGDDGVTASASAEGFQPEVSVAAQIVHESGAPTNRLFFACTYFVARVLISAPDRSTNIECDPNPGLEDGTYYDEAYATGSVSLTYNEADPLDGGSWGALSGLHPIRAFADIEDL